MSESAIANRSHALGTDAQAESKSSAKGVWPIFWAALLVRVLYMTLAHTYRIRPYEDHFDFGWEMARIARALVTGNGYADPFITGHTGPTAWLPPAYTLIIAAAFKLFGVYTPLSAWVLLTLNSICSAATVPAIYEIAARCFNRRVAIWSAWIWALYPAAMQYAVRWVWEMSLTTMLFAWVLVIALRVHGVGELRGEPAAANPQTTRRWLLFGLLWGLIALSNPSLLLFLPVCGLWMLLGAKRKFETIRKAVLAGVIFLACLAPWALRNWTIFHAFIPIRGNFGAELYLGNAPESIAMPWGTSVTSENDLDQYARLGEAQYVKQRGEMAEAYIAAHPKRFAELSLKRFYFFWAGVPHPLDRDPWVEYFRELNYCLFSITGLMGLALACKRQIPGAGLFAWAFLLLPLTYYFITVQARFRHPLEPLIAILTVYLFQSAHRRPRILTPKARIDVA
jgi:4-amino-4-deoxy-L-arabinose transferase-like glycosyltransferase